MPEHWATDDGCVHLCVAKGTLVPAKSLRCGHPQACRALRLPVAPAPPPPRSIPSHPQRHPHLHPNPYPHPHAVQVEVTLQSGGTKHKVTLAMLRNGRCALRPIA